jgi:tetratricopeptide (TPR) repeat protein
MAGFALLFFLLASALEASFVNLEIAFIHRIYLPSLFLAAGLLSVIRPTHLDRATVPLLLLAAALALATVERNREWRDETRFWALDLERGASPFRAMMNRGAALMDLGRAEEAARLMTQSLPLLRPGERMLMEIQIAGAWYSVEACARAREWLERLRAQYGDRPEILFHLAELEVRDGRPEAAEALLPALRAVPSHRLHARLIGALIAGRRDGPEARIEALEQLRDDLPFGLDAQHAEMVDMHLADAYLAAERFDDAYTIYREATERRPSNYFAWRQLYRMQRSAGDEANAARIARYLEERGVAVPE